MRQEKVSNPPRRTRAIRGDTPARARPKRPGWYFFSVAAAVMLALMIAGFYPFYLRGEGAAGRKISPQLLTLVVIHGSAMTAWVISFLCQSMLIPARKVRVHMKLGWVAIAAAVVLSVSGFMVAVQSVRQIPTAPFWGMAYRQFLLVMITEVALFSAFVAAGVAFRKKPKIHRAMMLLATLSILAGATVRMPVLVPLFGDGGWKGIFGPIFVIGALFLVVRSLSAGAFDRWLAAGYAAMVALYVAACMIAVSDGWDSFARSFLST